MILGDILLKCHPMKFIKTSFNYFFFSSPDLTWRDMQHVIVDTAQMTSPVDEGWMKNGAGKHFNHKFGFGRMDAAKMVERVKTWKNVGPQKTCVGQVFDKQR